MPFYYQRKAVLEEPLLDRRLNQAAKGVAELALVSYWQRLCYEGSMTKLCSLP